MKTTSHREDIANNYHLKVFFQVVWVERKIEIRAETMKNDVKPSRTVQWISDQSACFSR
jgi:hypothetical protein